MTASSEDSEEGAPKKLKKHQSKDSFSRVSQATQLSNSGFEMGGDETPGLTDFQNSAWINEDADSIYRYRIQYIGIRFNLGIGILVIFSSLFLI
jgi:hypothetical protein